MSLSAIDPGLYDGRYLIKGEDPEQFLSLVEDHRRRFANDPRNECLVAMMIHNEWQLRRYRKVEFQLTELLRRQSPGFVLPPEVNHRGFQTLQKMIATIQRSYDANLRLVLKLEKDSPPKTRSAKPASSRQIDEQPRGPFLITPPPPKTKPN
jgi:hypothetical protein